VCSLKPGHQPLDDRARIGRVRTAEPLDDGRIHRPVPVRPDRGDGFRPRRFPVDSIEKRRRIAELEGVLPVAKRREILEQAGEPTVEADRRIEGDGVVVVVRSERQALVVDRDTRIAGKDSDAVDRFVVVRREALLGDGRDLLFLEVRPHTEFPVAEDGVVQRPSAADRGDRCAAAEEHPSAGDTVSVRFGLVSRAHLGRWVAVFR